jgi:hypothetical protein
MTCMHSEYECAFADSGRGIFDRKIVESALADEVKPMFGEERTGSGRMRSEGSRIRYPRLRLSLRALVLKTRAVSDQRPSR